MKIRQGFVSNSSSSSFVVIGLKVSKNELNDIIVEKIDDLGFRLFNDDEDGYFDDNYFVIGETLVEGEYEGLDSSEYPVTELTEIVDLIREGTGLDGQPVLITGTRLT